MPIDFSVIAHALESILTFFLIGLAGYLMAGWGWFGKEANALVSRLIMQMSLPLYLIHNINSVLSKKDIPGLLGGIFPPFANIVLSLLMGYLLCRLLKVPEGRRGIFCNSCGFSNTMYIGLPVNMALFGEIALPYVLLYYFANTTLFWSVGNFLLASDAEGKKAGFFTMETAKKVLSPPVLGFLASLALLALDLKLPVFLANTAQYMGGLTTPLVLISIGVTLRGMGLRGIRFDAQLLAVIAARFVLCPLIMIGVAWAFSLSGLMAKVFLIQASLPAMSTIPMLAAYYKSDVEFSTTATSITTLLALATIPAYMALVTAIF